MSRKNRRFKDIPQMGLHHWRSTSTYFFLIWRWGNWLFALIWLITLPEPQPPNVRPTVLLCVVLTFFYSLIVTLYTPVSYLLRTGFPYWRRKRVNHSTESLARGKHLTKRDQPRLPGRSDETGILRPLLDTRNSHVNLAIYVFDVIFCGLITYYSAVNQSAPFGASSPFYRYGLSAVLVAGFSYGYRGGLLAALGYILFMIYGSIVYPPGQTLFYSIDHRPFDLAGSLIDSPLAALLAAFAAAQLNRAIATKRQEQDNVRRERALRGVSEVLVGPMNDQVYLLRRSIKAIRQGGHFEKLVIALIKNSQGEEPRPDFDTYAEADVSDANHPDVSEELIMLVAKTGRQHKYFDPLTASFGGSQYGIARLYQPFFKEKQIYLVMGAESTRFTPFDQRQEQFLAIIGSQLVIALENIRLTQEAAELATLAERTRIAREIHDGIAQLLFMLSLNSETCLAQVERAAQTLESGEADLLLPISQNLEKIVTISKQALWETRYYMFTLQPLVTGETTLAQMLTSQLHEFEAISGLSTRLEVEGHSEPFHGYQQGQQRKVQVGMAIFRITQEALTNAYKHANASSIEVHLHHWPERVTVEISDNGHGLTNHEASEQRIYSGRGMNGMRQRAEELSGTLEIKSNSMGGTRVVASIPL